LTRLALLYENGARSDDRRKALDLLRSAAQQGDAQAMYELARRYRYGTNGVHREFEQAAEFFASAAAKKYLPAMVEYGESLYVGLGRSSGRTRGPNPRRGVEQLKLAAQAGSVKAEQDLGFIYLNGHPCFGCATQSNAIIPDPALAMLWFARAAEAGDATSQVQLALMMEKGIGLPSRQPEIAERYWRLAAHSGDPYAEFEFANRLRRGLLVVKQEFGEEEPVVLLKRAMSQGSSQAALALADIFRKGELGEKQDPLEAMRHAYRAIELAVKADPLAPGATPFTEIAAGQLLAEMAKNGEANNSSGQPLLTPDEVDRLERYYGKTWTITGDNKRIERVKVVRLEVPLLPCRRWEPIWIWDWGRSESPTELEMRYIELSNTSCNNNAELRATLSDVFKQAKAANVAFADLITQKIQTAQNIADAPIRTGSRQGRRHR
jgi:TPR repeat protein